VNNALPHGAVDVNLFNAERLIAVKKAVAPGQAAEFHLGKLSLWIAVCTDAREGQPLDPAVLDGAGAPLPLACGATDIVLTGGGTGPAAAPLRFSMEHPAIF
jgi:hypothetical protein